MADRSKGSGKRSTDHRKDDHPELPAPPPQAAHLKHQGTSDARSEFETLGKAAARNSDAERAFVASKLHILKTHPAFDIVARGALVSQLVDRLARTEKDLATTPPPGGVGYGLFYNAGFKTGFSKGTSFYYEIVCPDPPGGNVNTFLYLTGTNRAALGVEAFVSYVGQNQTAFRVFDWARYPSAPWQTNVPFANLGNYLRTASAHGSPYPELPVWNSTYDIGGGNWRNEVFLYNHVRNTWDLIYRYDYAATEAQQKSGWIGSWGPIVETFQNSYSNTNPMGALNTQLIGRNQAGSWGSWHLLGPSDSYVRTDNTGFYLEFLDPNYSWVVKS